MLFTGFMAQHVKGCIVEVDCCDNERERVAELSRPLSKFITDSCLLIFHFCSLRLKLLTEVAETVSSSSFHQEIVLSMHKTLLVVVKCHMSWLHDVC